MIRKAQLILLDDNEATRDRRLLAALAVRPSLPRTDTSLTLSCISLLETKSPSSSGRFANTCRSFSLSVKSRMGTPIASSELPLATCRSTTGRRCWPFKAPRARSGRCSSSNTRRGSLRGTSTICSSRRIRKVSGVLGNAVDCALTLSRVLWQRRCCPEGDTQQPAQKGKLVRGTPRQDAGEVAGGECGNGLAELTHRYEGWLLDV